MPLLPTVGNDSNDLSCWTNYTISLSYNQGRPSRRTDSAVTDEDGKGDPVTRDVSGSLLWCSPLRAQFSPVEGDQKSYPSGSRHPSNKIPNDQNNTEAFKSFGDDAGNFSDEAISADGEEVKIRCHLEAEGATDRIDVDVQKISFRTVDKENKSKDQERKYKLSLVLSDGATDGVLYTKKDNDVGSALKASTKFGFTYNVRTELNTPRAPTNHSHGEECEHVRTSLGGIAVDWLPIQLPPIDDNVHGPLSLASPSTIKFLGPSCYIERAPFKAKLMAFPASPKVAVPFEVKYCIKNQTSYHQKLTLSMSEAHPGDVLDASDTVLVSGFVNGEVQLAPSESRVLCYSALVMRAGKTPMPALNISSQRYRSWVINDGQEKPRYFYVMP